MYLMRSWPWLWFPRTHLSPPPSPPVRVRQFVVEEIIPIVALSTRGRLDTAETTTEWRQCLVQCRLVFGRKQQLQMRRKNRVCDMPQPYVPVITELLDKSRFADLPLTELSVSRRRGDWRCVHVRDGITTLVYTVRLDAALGSFTRPERELKPLGNEPATGTLPAACLGDRVCAQSINDWCEERVE